MATASFVYWNGRWLSLSTVVNVISRKDGGNSWMPGSRRPKLGFWSPLDSLYETERSEITPNTLSQGRLHFKRSQCWLPDGISGTTTGGVRVILESKGLHFPQTLCHGQSEWTQERFSSHHVISLSWSQWLPFISRRLQVAGTALELEACALAWALPPVTG